MGHTLATHFILITSHALCSPFVILVSELESERFVAPFVDISRQTAPLSSNLPIRDNVHSSDSAGGISVVGIDLHFESKTLVSGTGPLFSFGICVQEMETDLIHCQFFNMSTISTQNRENSHGILFGSNVNQRLIGCSVSRSSNHQRGTSMLDPNLGGSLLCQNTSFSSCIGRTNADQTISHENRIQGQRFTSTHVTSESVVFMLCTFNDMRFTEDGNNLGGAAIHVKDTNAALAISQCSFHKCVATGKSNDGAAIFFYCTKTNRKAFSLLQSSFTECQSTYSYLASTSSACAIVLSFPPAITQCFFHLCNATGRCATLYFSSCPASITNSSFVKCASLESYGGAIGMYRSTSVALSSVQFRECSAYFAGSADIAYFNTTKELLNTSSIQFCDSTSGSPNIYDPESPSTVLSLIPQLVSNDGLFMIAISLNSENGKCLVEVELSSEMVGSMGVLLEGGNVPRLIHVPFGSAETPSSFGTIEVSVGVKGLLPVLGEGQTFSVRSVGMAGKRFLAELMEWRQN
ncbi:hypothetical protein BLNAU_18104 [Blattamonas nauphoetae]|uniref:Uncharacterized protein n=1 Tax=Blattamonas nauphoetae TaxID=2049346 RepID=A0ABQ9X9J9_9EUKA|nr:hypothetical protein BLNAU_18104 [Blattamonas nauphoetae]